MTVKEALLQECEKIENDEIKLFTQTAINNLPEYFFSVPASSSGKYHPSYALGDGGLVRHTLAAVRFAKHLFQLEQFQTKFTTDEQDCTIAALILHDGWKHGDKNSPHTVHEHPQVCADWACSGECFDGLLSSEHRGCIAQAIASHMGQWNTNKRSNTVLQKPSTKIQKFVHMCDYLASRKDIEILFDEIQESPSVSIEEFVMPFGEYKGERLLDIAKDHIDYLQWLKDNTRLSNPLKGFIDTILTIEKGASHAIS